MWTIQRIVSKGEYNYAVVPDHPKATKHGYVLEHRVVMENHLRRLLDATELVHHKDENKKNNALSNLEVVSAARHQQLHTVASVIHLKCAECGKMFKRRGNQRPQVKGYKNAFCSRSCNGKFQSKHLPHVCPLSSKQMKG